MNNDSHSNNAGQLLQMEKVAKELHVPIISREVADFLELILKIKKPHLILEVGTAIGYSSIIMAESLKQKVEIVTIEIDEERASTAQKNFKLFGLGDQINIKIGDAREILPLLRRQFDFIFLDAAKGQYIYYLDYVLDLLSDNGLIVADNVLYRGFVNKKGYLKHKHRTMVNNLRKYLDLIMNNKSLYSTVLPIGDGIAVSIRRNQYE